MVCARSANCRYHPRSKVKVVGVGDGIGGGFLVGSGVDVDCDAVIIVGCTCSVLPLERAVSCTPVSSMAGEEFGLAGEQAASNWIARREINRIRMGLLTFILYYVYPISSQYLVKA